MLYNEIFFNTLLYSSYILIIVSFFGLLKDAPEILNNLNNFINLYTSIILLYTFNPFKLNDITKVSKFDLKVAYNAGIILILTSFSSYISTLEIKARQEAEKIIYNYKQINKFNLK